MPLVHCRGGVDRNLFRLRLLPATLSVREEVIDDCWVVAVDPAMVSVTRVERRSYTEHLLYLEGLESDVGGPLCPCPRRAEIVSFVPEGGSDKERWLLPNFEVFRTMAPVTILSILSGDTGLETESPGCDRKLSGGVPFWSLGQPDIDPG